MRKFFGTFLLAMLCASFVQSQIVVTGVVKDETGEPLTGATVIIKGAKNGTITDSNGKFNLSTNTLNNVVLHVSYVGMKEQLLTLSKGKITGLTIMLEQLSNQLDELVVVGYGTQKKRDLTGSLSTVGEKELADLPVSSVAEALTGKMTGVQVTTTEGSPDADIKIRVRGGGSITQDNTPLYVVDGFIKDDINNISPNEIIECTVLKDAASTAIYGSRGANGVIIITTKSGQAGKPTINYNGYIGFRKVSKLLPVLNPYQFAKLQYERATWNNSVATDYENYFGSYSDIDLYKGIHGTNWQKETFGRTGFDQNHNLSLSGGKKGFVYNLSYSHQDYQAIMYMSDYKRDNLSGKFNISPLKWLKIDLAARYSETTINGSGANDVTGSEKSTSDSRVKNAVMYAPIPMKNMTLEDDELADAILSFYSPIDQAEQNDRLQNNKDLSANLGLTFNITKNLTFKTNFSYSNSDKTDKRFWGLISYYVKDGGALKINGVTPAPAITLSYPHTTTLQNSNTLNYSKKNFLPSQNISVLVGEEMYNRSSNTFSENVEALPVNYNSTQAWDSISKGIVNLPLNFISPDERLLSFFGRINYEAKDRYLIAMSMRADGSSKFSNGNQWGYFPSVSAGWRLSEEPFMKWADSWLSNLKFRGSYGQSGNNRIDNSAFWRSYSVSNNNYLPLFYNGRFTTVGSSLANPDLKWETTTTRGLGLDFGFVKNRFSGTFDYYSNITSDILIQMPIGGAGYSTQWQNVGQTSNKGFELSLKAVVVDQKDLNVTLGFNISANQNRVDNLGGLQSYSFNESWASSTATASYSYKVTPGSPVGLIYGFVNDGWYAADDFTWSASTNKWVMNATKYTAAGTVPSTGAILYKDAQGNVFVNNSTINGISWGPGSMKLKDFDGDGLITDNDRKLIGNANPVHFGSFNISAMYKGFDFNANINWVYGNTIYNASKIQMTSLYYRGRNLLMDGYNYYSQVDWTTGQRVTDPVLLEQMNSAATIWSPPAGVSAVTSWAMEDGSFVRLQNMTLGYSLPSKLIKKIFLKKVRFYLSGYNLFILTKYSGYDPEVDTRRKSYATPGVDYSAYPKSTSFNFGLNVTF